MNKPSTSRHTMRLLAATVALFAVLGPSSASAAPIEGAPIEVASAGVRLVHGLRGVVADVYLDGVVVLQTFQVERSTDLITLAPGQHSVEVRLTGDSLSNPPMLSSVIAVQGGESWSIVLHLSPEGLPTISQFLDDTTPIAPGQTRVVVRHTAAAPPIDVLLSDTPIAAGLANPGEIASQVVAGTYQVAVTQSGTPQALAPLQDVPFQEGTANDMYLIGDQALGTLGWIGVQTLGLQSAPAIVQTGDSGLAHAATVDGWSTRLAVIGGCAGVAFFSTVALRRRRIAAIRS